MTITATIGPSPGSTRRAPVATSQPAKPDLRGRGNVGPMSKPLGPYSPVVRAGDFVIVSGQGGMADGKVVEGGVTAETVQTMKNLATQLESVGASLHDIVKTTCFLTDMENFAEFQRGVCGSAR